MISIIEEIKAKKNKIISGVKKIAVCAVCTAVLGGIGAAGNIKVSADYKADAVTCQASVKAPALKKEQSINSGYTHPFKFQTNRITIHWNKVPGAVKYKVFIQGGKYKQPTLIATTNKTSYTAKKLKRATYYKFTVQSVASDGSVSAPSKEQKIKTARIDFDRNGWKSICRIVYHEVGRMDGSMWDKPIVYVSDCVVNRYEKAKYTNHPLWKPFYKNYSCIQNMIYQSGGFMSSTQLTRDGASYKKVPSKVKKAVVGAIYDKTIYKGIKNDKNVYYWCNRSYKSAGKGIAYQFRIPWGYFNVWRTYWG